MARDYARKKKQTKKGKAPISRFKLLVTLIVGGAFAVGLWFLSQQPKDASAPAAKVTEKVVTPPVSKNAANDTSAKQPAKDGFDFYTLLPESEVEPEVVDVYKSTPKDPSKQTNTLLQAGSFRNKADADRLRAKLILLNLPNVVSEKTVSSSGSTWYRVRIGPFSNRSMLNKAEDTLAQQNIESMRINRN